MHYYCSICRLSIFPSFPSSFKIQWARKNEIAALSFYQLCWKLSISKHPMPLAQWTRPSRTWGGGGGQFHRAALYPNYALVETLRLFPSPQILAAAFWSVQKRSKEHARNMHHNLITQGAWLGYFCQTLGFKYIKQHRVVLCSQCVLLLSFWLVLCSQCVILFLAFWLAVNAHACTQQLPSKVDNKL